MTIKRSAILIVLVVSLVSCSNRQNGEVSVKEDLTAKQLLQGIWVNDETEMPLMRIEGDTVYYANPQSAPVPFKVVHDTIYIYSNEPVAYKIDRQTEYSFWFHSLADEVIKLHKSENAEDSLVFTSREVEVISTTPEVIKKDSIVIYKNTRYRGYVYINPSKMKVFKTSYSENGISVDNVYYDNVIHICVYEGKKMLYGQDITKKMFADIFPAEMLDQAILADMNFMGVDSKGYHYQATLGIPESSVYNLVNMIIGFDNTMNIEKADLFRFFFTTVFISSHRHSVDVWPWAFRLYCCYGRSCFLLAYVRFHGRPVFLLRQMLSACIRVLHPALREPVSYRCPYPGIFRYS